MGFGDLFKKKTQDEIDLEEVSSSTGISQASMSNNDTIPEAK